MSSAATGYVSKDDEFCIKNKEFCIKNKELCIKNKDFCISMMKFAVDGELRHHGVVATGPGRMTGEE